MYHKTPTTNEKSLSKITLFSNLGEEKKSVIEKKCEWFTFQPNQVIIDFRDQSHDVYFVASGQVQAVIYSFSGKKVPYRVINAGDLFGELSAIDRESRSARVEAISECVIARMSSDVFRSVISQYSEISEILMKHFCSQIRKLTDRVFEFSTLAVNNRIHAELLRLGLPNIMEDGKAIIDPAPTHIEIANRISTHREAVTRELNLLSKLGLIERNKTCLIIKNIEELKAKVEDVLPL